MLMFKTQSEMETKEIAIKLAEMLHPGDVITLDGDLGAGKTTFTKGLAEGLEIKRTVNSPTYTIIKEYEGRIPLYHMDVYRLEGSEEDIGFDEYFEGEGVTVVEWSLFIESYLPVNRLMISIEKVDEQQRSITINPKGDRYEQISKELKE
ncbi:tRNA (adenosine(37)-N6)-threonylcarbamoyltransferase complex ATPase subunit type 1 TsaE [Halalkalibacillus halophilus]|uniref:tRNA (adenosine(37)-N6)-threonylcarbamoyltransferase complex ATPase subunit type 1 TsaE n=1 Tax=Halalkalibacillus halophilus TaxID=392827 RepID=UPI0004148063|nr:tRNA (adenosine(37)-N6)-threonylcarbamoyltransferase complex ATPase subunit type 1 TsaE [Halalkalibacillus halophilus]